MSIPSSASAKTFQRPLLLVLALVVLLAGAPAPAAENEASKLHPRIEELATYNPYGELSLIVSFRSSLSPSQTTMLSNLGARSIGPLAFIDSYAVTMAAVDALALEDQSDVGYVTFDAPVRSSVSSSEETVSSTGAADAPAGRTGSGVTVALLDSGVADHPDLSGKLLASVDFTGSSGVSKSADPYGHGTHVAGVLSGSGAASQGLYKGLAPGASLVSVRVLDGHGLGTTSSVIRGVDWAVENRDRLGIRVLHLALGHPIFEPASRDPLVRAVERAQAFGLVVVVSAGSFGENGNFSITSPGNAAGATTVGSSTDGDTVSLMGNTVGSSTDGDSTSFVGGDMEFGSSTDGDSVTSTGVPEGSVSSFSSQGPSYLDHLLKPDLVARGERVVSLRVPGSALDLQFPENRVQADGSLASSYFELSGTGMAVARVAAAVALMLEGDPDLTPATVKARLMISADRERDANPLRWGAGLLDVPGALADEGHADSADSPRVRRDEVCCDLLVDDPSAPGADPLPWSDPYLWSEPLLWNHDPADLDDLALWSDTFQPLD